MPRSSPRLAAAIHLPAAECRFAILDGQPGLISRNVTPQGFNLNTGTTYLPEVEGYQRRPSAESDSDAASSHDLKPGDRLELRCEPDNEFNERALLVRQTGDRLGYVPDPLLDYVHQIMERPFELVVDRVNPPEAGMHMRLLVRLTGELVA